MRLSIISLAGIARTDVAVGTERDPSIACTTRAETPRIGSSEDADGVIKTGTGLTIGSAGVGCDAAVSRRTGCCGAGATGAGTGAATGAGCETTGAGCAAFCFAFGTGGTPLLGGAAVTGAPGLLSLKYSTHAGSTEEGFAKYCSYISSTSQSFAPKSCADTGKLLLH